MTVVLIVASGAAWEPTALRLLGERPDIVVLRRCVDVDDLLAAASAGQAEVAVAGAGRAGAGPDRDRAPARARGAAGGDPPRRRRPSTAAALRAARIGISVVVTEDDLDQLPDLVAETELPVTAVRPDPGPVPPRGRRARAGAGGLGRRRCPGAHHPRVRDRRRAGPAPAPALVLVDADPYGGAVAQQLGIMDEVSGLLTAARWAATGDLADRFAIGAARDRPAPERGDRAAAR